MQGLEKKQFELIIIAAWVGEISRSMSVAKLDRNTESRPIARPRSLIQGGPAAQAQFNK